MTLKRNEKRPTISPNMALKHIAQIADLRHRALALSYTAALIPSDPLAVALAESVNVAEAGPWGANVFARLQLATADGAPVSRRRKKRILQFDGQPNMFMDFANDTRTSEIEPENPPAERASSPEGK